MATSARRFSTTNDARATTASVAPLHVRISGASLCVQKISSGNANVPADLTQQYRRNVAPLMHGDGSAATITMTELPM